MRYIDYYPYFLKDVYEFKQLGNVMDNLIDLFKSDKERLKNELFLMSANSEGLMIWERILELPVTDTDVEVRRFKIRSKLLGDNTSLKTKLNALIGEGKYKITVFPQECHIVFNLELSVQSLKSAVIELLEKVLPMNLTYEINFAYNKHIDLVQYSHNELQDYTHKELNAKKIGNGVLN